MSAATRLFAIVVVLALAAPGVWRILATGMSDHLASVDPQRALEWDAGNPRAMAVLARRQLAAGKPEQARQTAQHLLQHEPLNGAGFLVLSEIATAQADKTAAARASEIAIRRAPYGLTPRAWLASEQISQGDFKEALDNLDRILRISPGQQKRLFPILIELADNADFADALARKLAEQPAWRNSFIGSVLRTASPERLAAIFSALQRHGSLDTVATDRWMDRLVKDGKWGEAYARWVAGIQTSAPLRLSHVYNGDFERAPSGAGFDWRIGDSVGVVIERAGLIGTHGSHAVQLTFLGRRVDAIPLHQWLLLVPGSYRLSFQAKAQDLRSNRGLQWMLRCLDDGRELAASERLDGNFEWKAIELEFAVPEQACQAQDLWLRNAGAAAAGKIIRGSILFDDFAIERVAHDPRPAHSPQPSH